VQELPQASKSSGTPVYWNNTVYFTGTHSPVYAYTLLNGMLVVPASVQSVTMGGGGQAVLTANGNSNGILWVITGKTIYALDAITLKTLYVTWQAANGRDVVSGVAHFATPIAADGKVFIGTQNSLVVYGLLSGSASLGGSGNSHRVVSGSPLQAEAGGPGR
jgi:outer membrane protein assembly factor BamB